MMLDGGRVGNDAHMLNAFKDEDQKKYAIDVIKTILFYDEDCLKWRRETQKGQIAQTERLMTVTKGGLDMPKRKRKFYTGSTTAEILGPVVLPAWDSSDEWILSYGDKKDIFGSNRVACGGKEEECSYEKYEEVPQIIAHLPVGQGRSSKKSRELSAHHSQLSNRQSRESNCESPINSLLTHY